MKCLTAILVLITFLFVILPMSTAQEKAPKLPSFDECDRAKNEDEIKVFLRRIDEEIAKLTRSYPQLSAWGQELRETDKRFEGKRVNDNELVYFHAMRRSRSSNYKDWYEENGCQIRIRVYTECEMMRLQGPGVKNKLFGLQMGDRYIVATVITERPEVPELERKITEMIRMQAKEAEKLWRK